MRIILLLVALAHACSLHAQTGANVLGRVLDADTQQPLVGATVHIALSDTSQKTTTDSRGAFRFQMLPVGIHRVRAELVGYEPSSVPEVWARAGRSEDLTIALRRKPLELEAVEIRGDALDRMRMIGTHTLSVEQTLRLPATFLDPARLASTRPGIATVNDQANHISVRGNGPAANAYLLEGAEIVCPNHLTNAGTASDLPTLSGGGVTILSAQMLGPSRLLTGGFGAGYGNALGGILDMRLRRGSSERQGFTAQAGLLGIDLSAEGPIDSAGRSTYLINYRYSTLGLLSALGVDLGDEAISFQDLSFHVAMPIGRASLSLFGLGGMSENVHAAKADTAEWEFDKDSEDIRYAGRMGAAGLTFAMPLGSKTHWRSTVVISENDQSRKSEGFHGTGAIIARTSTALFERKITGITRVSGRLGDNVSYETGGSAMERTVVKNLLFNETVSGWLLRPYASVRVALNARMRLETGIAYALYSANSTSAFEPRITTAYALGDRSALSVSIGQRSQLPAVQLYYVKPASNPWDNSAIGLQRMREVVLAFDHSLKPRARIHVEAYHQQRSMAASGDATRWIPPFNDDGSLSNAWDNPLVLDLRSAGEGSNTGIECSYDRDFDRNRYLHVNAAAFRSTYADVDGRTHESRWSQGFLANLIVGREFESRNERRVRVWGVNARGVLAGGLKASPIDSTWSMFSGGTVHDPSRPFTEQLPLYHRIDLRVYLKRERTGRSGQCSLDLQNILNTRNEAYRYFDQRQGKVVAQEQLGLIPNLSYRIEF
ncbi:MAG: carboxypeptidase regulatory-like domain-containing protein [Flavobacteriales bacterium]|nr:carboxypeptidase regulatory-like domain-containing protein [Flavobacteriales bacterium]